MRGNTESQALRGRLAEICAQRLPPDAAELVESLARSAIRLRHTDEVASSHLGGVALLDHPDRWPRLNERPLSLVAVVDLAELAPFESDPVLPRAGVLNFFYDYVEQPWGFEPGDSGGWKVVLTDRAVLNR